ncbi:hypothetical protein ABR39_23370 [Enterobacter genomosp. O]|nr:hypothetical protein ABR39_23370 [Enterobacter genomosp. O]
MDAFGSLPAVRIRIGFSITLTTQGSPGEFGVFYREVFLIAVRTYLERGIGWLGDFVATVVAAVSTGRSVASVRNASFVHSQISKKNATTL